MTKVTWMTLGFAGLAVAQVPVAQAPVAQALAKVDFARDVQPILRQNCVGCHGPAQQSNGLRLDRKSSVMKAGTRRIVPGFIENSFVYHRLMGNVYGQQMPPGKALKAEQIATIKAWIEQGADWPEALANEANLPPIEPKAVAMVDALHRGNVASFLKSADDDAKLLNARGPEGSTPFMYAVLYAHPATLTKLLKLGADPNRQNDAGATALMWAATDLEKTRLLLAHGANANARSADLRTPLMIAARRPGGAPIVKLLLERGANANPNARPETESSPLTEAATAGEVESIKLLLSHRADAKAAGQPALSLSSMMCGMPCFEPIAAKIADPKVFSGSLQDVANNGDIKPVRYLLEHGADVKAIDPFGRTALMYAAGSDVLPLDIVKLLVEKGADVNAKNQHQDSVDYGLTVLEIAKLHGDTPIVDLLLKAGAQTSGRAAPMLKPRQQNSIRSAIEGGLRGVQRGDQNFSAKSGCFSCHENSLAAMTVGLARKRGLPVNEQAVREQKRIQLFHLEKSRDQLHQNFSNPTFDYFGPQLWAYVLLGLAAENHPADLDTDAVAIYLKNHQTAEGHWPYPPGDTRPPLGHKYIGQTALALRALQLYAPKVDPAAYEKSIRLAASWLTKARPITSDDLSWRLLGLAWAGKDKAAVAEAKRDLLAVQRADGGWSDMPSMASAAYATGKALVSLEAAGVPVADAAYQNGVRYLLRTQQEDGSWYVKTRSLAFQPYFDNGSAHGFDQFISDAGTSWATMALTLALPEGPTASRIP